MTTDNQPDSFGERDQFDGDEDGVDPTTLAPLATEEEWPAMLAELAAACAPRRFALCEVWGERVDGRVFGWGAVFPDRAVVLWPDGRLAGLFRSAERARDLFGRCYDLHLVWLDQEQAAAGSPSVGN